MSSREALGGWRWRQKRDHGTVCGAVEERGQRGKDEVDPGAFRGDRDEV